MRIGEGFAKEGPVRLTRYRREVVEGARSWVTRSAHEKALRRFQSQGLVFDAKCLGQRGRSYLFIAQALKASVRRSVFSSQKSVS